MRPVTARAEPTHEQQAESDEQQARPNQPARRDPGREPARREHAMQMRLRDLLGDDRYEQLRRLLTRAVRPCGRLAGAGSPATGAAGNFGGLTHSDEGSMTERSSVSMTRWIKPLSWACSSSES